MALSSKKNNRRCIVCSKEYQFCSHCQDGEIKPSWYNIFHDQNCHDIYDAVANIYPVQGKEAAKISLDKCDLSNKINFHPNIVKAINEIYGIDIKDENKENKVEEENKTEEVKVEETNEKVEENKETIAITTSSTTDVKVEEAEKAESVKTEEIKNTSVKAKIVNKNKK